MFNDKYLENDKIEKETFFFTRVADRNPFLSPILCKCGNARITKTF